MSNQSRSPDQPAEPLSTVLTGKASAQSGNSAVSADKGLELLRNEVIESEKAQADFIKWKLILVASLGSASLGFSKSELIGNAEYLICLVPLVCAYADLVYFHQALRIVVIGAFLRSIDIEEHPHTSLLKAYESFTETTRSKERSDSFAFEGWAVRGSSLTLSALVILFCAVVSFAKEGLHFDLKKFSLYLIAGIAGFVLTFFIVGAFEHKKMVVDRLSQGSNALECRTRR
jgi:hypothetical protein